MDPTLTHAELVAAIDHLCADQRIEVVLTALSETLAHVITTRGCDADEAIGIVSRVTREWLSSGLLAWRLAPAPSRVH
jgi:hypothetical protein